VGAINDLVADDDPRIARSSEEKIPNAMIVAVAVAGFDHQPDVVSLHRKCSTESVDHGQGILSGGGRVEVERGQKNEATFVETKILTLQPAVRHGGERNGHA